MRIAVSIAIVICLISSLDLARLTVGRAADVDDRRVPTCTTERHLYGTIESVQDSTVVFKSTAIKSTRAAGIVRLLITRAMIRPKGTIVRRGLVARAYGCFAKNKEDQTIFRTTYLTLADDFDELAYIPDRPSESTEAGEATERQSRTTTTVVNAMKSPAVYPTASAQPTGASPLPTQSAIAGGVDRACSGWRWPVKIGADKYASGISLSPTSVTVAELNASKPSSRPVDARVGPAETTVYELANVTLVKIYREHDRDYHLIVKDGAGNPVTLESPDPACAGASVFRSQIAAVRSYLDANPPTAGTQLTATGVGFYDAHGSGGMELHPLLAVCEGLDCAPKP